ncbi:hypothetical protein C2E23DRAFT_861949 [Lenzites betulinus]|nr:hypothetical protein C2E23DRAFT_861949 [Lenzites betulinus]
MTHMIIQGYITVAVVHAAWGFSGRYPNVVVPRFPLLQLVSVGAHLAIHIMDSMYDRILTFARRRTMARTFILQEWEANSVGTASNTDWSGSEKGLPRSSIEGFLGRLQEWDREEDKGSGPL